MALFSRDGHLVIALCKARQLSATGRIGEAIGQRACANRAFIRCGVDARDTPSDIDAKRDRLIAAGRARPDDTFVCVRWKRPGEA